MRGAVVWLLAAGIIVVATAPAAACDYVPALSVDEVAGAGPGGELERVLLQNRTLRGVVEHEVVARAPALVPLTSGGARAVVVRLWGEGSEEIADLPVVSEVRVPYLGDGGMSCDFPGTALAGAGVLSAVVDDEVRVWREPIGPEDLVHHFADGVPDEARARLDEAFGAPVVHEVTTLTRTRAHVAVWWPHALAVAMVAVVVVVVRRRLRGAR